jgi:hypothetical protein
LSEHIGQVCLNIALVLYLIHYLPQLLHNRHVENRIQLNIHFHGLLSIGYLSDLIFAFGMNMPWQYCMVSTVGVVCLFMQHVQLKKQYHQRRLFSYYQLLIGFFAAIFFLSLYLKLPTPFFLGMGYVCQAAIWTYTLPQIWHNFRNKTGKGLHSAYLGMTIACYGLDVIASTTLHWPLPAVIGAFYGLACKTILLSQAILYKNKAFPQVLQTTRF